MKVFAACGLIGAFLFTAMAYQAGLFTGSNAFLGDDDDGSVPQAKPRPSATEPENKKEKPPPAPFPEALADAIWSKPVLQAAEFKPGKGLQPFVFLNSEGKLHAWQDRLDDDWKAETVESTRLVVLL